MTLSFPMSCRNTVSGRRSRKKRSPAPASRDARRPCLRVLREAPHSEFRRCATDRRHRLPEAARAAPGFPPTWSDGGPRRRERRDSRNRSACRISSIQTTTVSRKLPTIMPTAVSTAIAVDRAPTSTDVRRSDPARLRVASSASTPNTRRISPAVIVARPETSEGIERARTRRSRAARKDSHRPVFH